jgi:hypothetical protein
MDTKERDWPRCFPCNQPVDIARVYFESFSWLLDRQNRDGSWGRNWQQKAVYTPHGVQLFTQAGFPPDHPRFRASTGWLKKQISHNQRPLWYGRIPALASAGEIEWLIHNKDIALFLDDLDKSKIEDFFWYVLPIMISLNKAGHDAPYAEVAEQLRKFERAFGEDYVAVAHKPNHTGLAALYLHTVNPEAHKDKVQRFVNWILVDRRQEDTGVVHWDGSIGITAYVVMDLVGLGLLYDPEITQLVEGCLSLFKPLPEGNMPPDRFTTTFDTSLHEDSLYTTLLALRAMATVLGRENCVMRSAAVIGIQRYVDRSWKSDFGRFARRHRRALIIGAATFTSFMLASVLLFLLDVKNLVINISATIFGAILGVLIDRVLSKLDDQ